MQRFENKYDLMNAAYQDHNIKKGTIALLQYLLFKSNKEQCFPAVDTIAKALGCCRRTVQYNMRKLEKAGYIIRKDRWYNHQQLSNQYMFNFGITEDPEKGDLRYSDQEYDILNGIYSKKSEICKVDEIKKIYKTMNLSAREKGMCVYLFHRANQKGIVYGSPDEFCRALGLGCLTLKKILVKLLKKGIIKVTTPVIHGCKMIAIMLTGNTYDENLDAECKTVSDMCVAAENPEVPDIPYKSVKSIGKKFRYFLGNVLHKIRTILQI